jgi:hypothetical protein
MAIPVCGPQNAFVRRKDVAMAARWTSVLSLEVSDPIQLPLRTKLISNPNPIVSAVLNVGEHFVVEEILKFAFGRR